MNENILKNCDEKQDYVIKALDLAFEDKMYAAFFLLRDNFDLSELSDNEIKKILLGEYRVRWNSGDCIDIIDVPNSYQYSRMSLLKEKYNKIISYKDSFYKIIDKGDLNMFLAMMNIKVKANVIYKSDSLKKIMFSVKGEYFMVTEENVLYLDKTEISSFNLFKM